MHGAFAGADGVQAEGGLAARTRNTLQTPRLIKLHPHATRKLRDLLPAVPR